MFEGKVPPESGPFRVQYLEANGLANLDQARLWLDEVLGGLPPVPVELVENGSADRARALTGPEAHERWSTIRRDMPAEVLETIADQLEGAVTSAVAAFNFLEDHPLREEAHKVVHRTAAVRGGLLGCKIGLKGESLESECPVDLSHLRWGFSPGIVADFVCNICSSPIEDCDHIAGTTYVAVAGRFGKVCSLCHSATCDHVEGEVYSIEAVSYATAIRSEEVSVVERPLYPLARAAAFTLPRPPSQVELVAVETGTLECNACLGPCRGMKTFAEWQAGSGDDEAS